MEQSAAKSQNPAPWRRPVVLFVDDEERVLRSLSLLFRGEFEVLTCVDPAQALERVQQRHVDVVVADQRMPGLSGQELLYLVKQVSPHAMRILLTGYSDRQAVIDSINDSEIFRYLTKPWRADTLRDTLHEAVAAACESREITLVATQPAAARGAASGILVLDDDCHSFDLVADALKRERGADLPVWWARNLEEALSVLGSEPVDVIICDVQVESDAVSDLLKTLKQVKPAVLSIVVTQYKDNALLSDLINQGQIYRFLPKPLVRAHLSRALWSALSQARLLRENPAIQCRYRAAPSDPSGALAQRILATLRPQTQAWKHA